MKIYVVGSSKNKFLPLDNIREKFLIDQKHEGDNIDIVNPWYCEVTGLYYLWKHCNDDIVGLEHYRRTFELNENQINDILKTNDIILHNSDRRITWISKTIEDRLNRGWGYGSMRTVLKHYLFCLRYLYPEYWETAQEVLQYRWHYQFNMFICKRELFDKYMTWLSSICKLYEENFGCKNDPLRSTGYVVEMFLSTLWVVHNKLIVHDHDVHVYNFPKIGYK